MLINRRDITSSKVRPRPGLQPVGGPAAILTPTVTLVQLCLRGNRPPEYLCPFCLLNVPAVIPAVTPPQGMLVTTRLCTYRSPYIMTTTRQQRPQKSLPYNDPNKDHPAVTRFCGHLGSDLYIEAPIP